MPGWLSRAVITWVMAGPAGMAGMAQRDPLSHRSGPHPPPPKRAWCCPSSQIPGGAMVSADTACEIVHNAVSAETALTRKAEIMTLSISALSAANPDVARSSGHG